MLEMAKVHETSRRAPLRVRPRRVLVVDDDRDIRELLGELLASEGYEVASAGDGQRALAEARANRPDVILLDLMMPVMSGWEFRKEQLRDPRLSDIPVVVVTAFEESLDGTALLRKPFMVEDVLDAVQRLSA
jgi:CheY-like chemotaxis protein